MTASSVEVVSMPQKAAQSLATTPAPAAEEESWRRGVATKVEWGRCSESEARVYASKKNASEDSYAV